MKNNIKQILCLECSRSCYGFLKYGQHPVCSMVCFRNLITTGKIPKLFPERGYPELGISAPSKGYQHGK